MVAEEKALSDGLSLVLQHRQSSSGTGPGLVSQHLDQGPLPHEHLVNVQQDVATFHNHSLYGQVLSDVFCFWNLNIMFIVPLFYLKTLSSWLKVYESVTALFENPIMAIFSDTKT